MFGIEIGCTFTLFGLKIFAHVQRITILFTVFPSSILILTRKFKIYSCKQSAYGKRDKIRKKKFNDK